jgi:hypothetical protein
VNRVAILNREADSYVSRLVNRSRIALVLVHHEALALGAHQDAVACNLDVFPADSFGVFTRRRDCRFVHKVCELCSRKTGSAACDPLKVET